LDKGGALRRFRSFPPGLYVTDVGKKLVEIIRLEEFLLIAAAGRTRTRLEPALHCLTDRDFALLEVLSGVLVDPIADLQLLDYARNQAEMIENFALRKLFPSGLGRLSPLRLGYTIY